MSIPKQDERTPGRFWAEKREGRWQVQMEHRGPDSSFCVAQINHWADDGEALANQIVQAVNAYTSTEALREALMLAEKADRIHSKCQECEDGAQAPEACEHCFPSADDARVARRNVLKALGVKMRDVDRAQSCDCSQEDVHDYGPCDENCRALSGSPAPSTEGLRELASEARFLLNRLSELSFDDLDDHTRDFNGHVEPSISRLGKLLDAIEARAALSGSPDNDRHHSENDNARLRDALTEARRMCWTAVRLGIDDPTFDPDKHALIQKIDAALSSSPPPSTEGLRGWLPIETAPRDGTAVLGIDAKGRTRKMWWFAPSSRTQHWMNCETQSPFKAVGWMPLPPAPDAARTALAGVTAPEGLGVAAQDVLCERQRQQSAEGWTPEHDDTHTHFEMARAAAFYALHTAAEILPEPHWPDTPSNRYGLFLTADQAWPPQWDHVAWKKPKDARRNLVRAAALLIAEIERLDRTALEASHKGGK